MTREEIMQLNTDYLNDCESEHEMNELFYYLLQLQEHEPTLDKHVKNEVNAVLDKIRAEIEQAKIYILKTEDGKEIKASANDVINPDNRNYTSGLNTALQIINKYKKNNNQ